jgi:hypothetical protein
MRKILILLLCCTTVLLAGYVGPRAYSSWKQTHFLSLARRFAAQGDLRNAVLSAGQVLGANPRNLEACRFMAELAETNNSPEAVLWRSRALDLVPDSPEDRLDLVRDALAQGDLLTATNALAGVHDAATNTAHYHLLAGLAAVATRQIPQAEAHFTQAAQLEPTNPIPNLNLAVLRLNDTNASARSEARAALQRLTAEPSLRSQIFRELIADALRHNQTNDALAFAGKLAEPTNAPFADRILRLEVLHTLHNEALTSTLASCQKSAVEDPAKIYQLAIWQAASQGPEKALFWLESLPAQVQSNRAIQLVQSECRVDLQDWRELQLALPKQNWAELEFVRHAFLTRALRGLDLKSSADTEWPMALNATDYRKESLLMLLRLAEVWQWQSESEELLWIFINRYPEEKWAYTALQTGLYATGRTRSLMSLYEQEAKRDPSDVEAKNNLAMTALLLEAMEIKPYDLAREIYEQHATNAAFVSTYAFSLHLQKKDSEALRVMRQLKADDLNKPAVAGYYGLFLEAAGSNVLAETYLDGAAKAVLLPEERTLFAQAKARLGHVGGSNN